MMAHRQGHRPSAAQSRAAVVPIEQAAIARALERRQRYRYVQPRVEPVPDGWLVVSPNCSRSVDPQGHEIPIAWLQRAGAAWSLYARDHGAGVWVRRMPPAPLHRVLALLCEDPNREFWP